MLLITDKFMEDEQRAGGFDNKYTAAHKKLPLAQS
jgi:hypothetical protein